MKLNSESETKPAQRCFQTVPEHRLGASPGFRGCLGHVTENSEAKRPCTEARMLGVDCIPTSDTAEEIEGTDKTFS